MKDLLEEILKGKLAIFFAVFGALLALILGLVSGVDLLNVLLRLFFGALIMGGVGAGVQIVLKKVLSPEDYDSLFFGSPSSSEAPSETMGKVDLTDNSSVSPEELLHHQEREPMAYVAQETAPAENAGFQEMQFGSSDAPSPPPSSSSLHSSEEVKVSKSLGADGTTNIKIKMGDKNINTDSKLVAKAIKTILQRE